jgi:hypothetical protein
MKSVWIYVDTRKQVGDINHLQVFASPEAADQWFAEYDAEGVAFDFDHAYSLVVRPFGSFECGLHLSDRSLATLLLLRPRNLFVAAFAFTLRMS